METAKVSKTFSSNKYNDDALGIKAQHIIACLTGNTRFANPDPTLATVQTACSAFTTSVAKALNGTKQDTADKRAKRISLEDLLQKLADFVQRTSLGAEVSILSSGFDICKKPSFVGMLARPENFKLKIGSNKGSMELICDAVANAHFYEFEYTQTPINADSLWIKRTSTKRSILIEGLQSGTEYAFKVAAGGSSPSRQWTNAITSFIL